MWWVPFGEVSELTAETIHALLEGKETADFDTKQPFVVIDVRTEGEFQNGHLKGAMNASYLPPWRFRSKLEERVKDRPKDGLVILA